MASIWILIKGLPTMLWSWAHKIFQFFFSAGTQVIKCFGVWHSPCLKLGGFVTLSDGALSRIVFEWQGVVTGFVWVTEVCHCGWRMSVTESSWVSKSLALECLSVWHSGTGVSQGLAQEGRTIFGWWVSECLALWHWSVVRSGTESIWMSKGLAFTLSWEARSNQIAGLRAIVQSDCRTACNHAIGLYHGVFVDCGTACNRAIRLQYCV